MTISVVTPQSLGKAEKNIDTCPVSNLPTTPPSDAVWGDCTDRRGENKEGRVIRTYEYLGIPKAQGRPRAARMGKFVRVYEAKEDTANKSNIRAQIVNQNPEYHDGTPVSVTILTYFPRPKSHYRKVGLSATAPKKHTQKPDAENVAKAVLDALTGVCWRDDAQVCSLTVSKVWTDKEPMTLITVAEAGN